MPKHRDKPRSCDACRKRKTRCVALSNELCEYCQRVGKQCTFETMESTDQSAPLQIEITPIERDKPVRYESLGPTVALPGYDSIMLAGPSGDQDPVLLQYYEKDSDGLSKFVNYGIRNVDNTKGRLPVEFMMFRKPLSTHTEKIAEVQREQILELAKPYSERLLALYFKFIDWSYPAVDKEAFYQAYYFDRAQLHSGLFASMMALSTIYWKYDRQLCVRPIPAKLTAGLWELAQARIEQEMAAPTLSTLQCQLLFLQKRLPRDDPSELSAMSVQVSKAVACAFTLGLHVDCSHWNISEHEKMVRRRLWAVLYVSEKWSAAVLGRPSLLNSQQWTVQLFESKFAEEQLFVEMFKVTEILDPVLDEFYGARVRYGGNFSTTSDTTLNRVDYFLDKLKKWRDDLPEGLSSMDPKAGDFCRNGQLLLCGLTLEVLLLRVKLHPTNMACSKFGDYRKQARKTIQNVIKYTGAITHSHLHAFWLSASSLEFSSLAHFVFFYFVQGRPEEQAEMGPHVRKWLWALRVLSNAWQEGTGLAAMRMDSVFHMGSTSVTIPQPSLRELAEANGSTFDFTDVFGPSDILHDDIVPLDAQDAVFENQEYYQDDHNSILDNITIDDLVNDDLHEILSKALADLPKPG